jgi:hypothetical protein
MREAFRQTAAAYSINAMMKITLGGAVKIAAWKDRQCF